MPIWRSQKVAFIHIPKCGGMSVLSGLKAYWGAPELFGLIPAGESSSYNIHYTRHWQHIYVSTMRHVIGAEWQDYFRFTFVRNPWARYLSYYYYHLGRFKASAEFRAQNPEAVRVFSKTSSFSEWAQEEDYVIPQFKYLLGSADQPEVDQTFHVEEFARDYSLLCLKYKLSPQVPWVNKTNHSHYADYYDDNARLIVAQKFDKDISLLGYEFGDSPSV